MTRMAVALATLCVAATPLCVVGASTLAAQTFAQIEAEPIVKLGL